jgi:RNA polymerase sigma-70 factor (ECF subfamily)
VSDPLEPRSADAQPPVPIDPQGSTALLLIRARSGDLRARDSLARRYTVLLRQWAHGRIPARARDLVDTEDLVQSALYRAFGRLDEFEDRGGGAFLAYVRTILLNQIRDEARRSSRRPEHGELGDDFRSEDTSPLDKLIRREQLERYERALESLSPKRREAVIMRFEMGCPYREIAEALGLPSGNSARMLSARGIVAMTLALKETP